MPKIGLYQLHVIETGRFRLDGGAMFGIIPKPLWERKISPDAGNRIPLHMRCLLLESSDRLILIDNGMGDKSDARFKQIYGVDLEFAELNRSLKAAGFGAEDISDVILTHLHFDHCGGSTTRVGDRTEVAFRQAQYHVQRAHWDWANSPNPREKGSFLDENLTPLLESGQLNLLDSEGDLFPGVSVRKVHGHTEAQQIVKITGPEGTLVFVADLLPTTAHLAPVWGMGYDIRPLVTIAEKSVFLEEALREGWQLFFEHDPAIEVSGLAQGGRSIEAVEGRPLQEL